MLHVILLELLHVMSYSTPMVIKTSAHYQREYRKRLREEGLVKKEIWILPEQRQNASAMEKELRKPLFSESGIPADENGSDRAKWRTGALFGELIASEMVRTGKASVELIDGLAPAMMITMLNRFYGRRALYKTKQPLTTPFYEHRIIIPCRQFAWVSVRKRTTTSWKARLVQLRASTT